MLHMHVQTSNLCLKGKHLRFYKLSFVRYFTKNFFEIFILQANMSKQSKPDVGFSLHLEESLQNDS